jgi:hypothetical protein
MCFDFVLVVEEALILFLSFIEDAFIEVGFITVPDLLSITPFYSFFNN